jgi:hypothetical protein
MGTQALPEQLDIAAQGRLACELDHAQAGQSLRTLHRAHEVAEARRDGAVDAELALLDPVRQPDV